MGTEAIRSKDPNGRDRPSRATGYKFFLLAGGALPVAADCRLRKWAGHEETMHGLIYLVGLIVVILAVLSFFGLR